MPKIKTESAKVASLIRKTLKTNKIAAKVYKFGDDAVFVKILSEEYPVGYIKKRLSNYVKGWFDAYEDIYRYTNQSDGPMVKWLFVTDDSDPLDQYPSSCREDDDPLVPF